jgi:hypothetical protein
LTRGLAERARGRRSAQPARDLGSIKASKGKKMKANKLSFSFMSFSESGLFNGL